MPLQITQVSKGVSSETDLAALEIKVSSVSKAGPPMEARIVAFAARRVIEYLEVR